MKPVIIGALLMTLVGCSNNEKIEQVQRLDPSWPDAVEQYQGDWKVLTVDDKLYVALPYNEFTKFTVFLGDVKRYMTDSNQVICYYRAHLKEQKCTPTVKE